MNKFKGDCVQVTDLGAPTIVFLGDEYNTEDARAILYHLERLINRAEKCAKQLEAENIPCADDLPF